MIGSRSVVGGRSIAGRVGFMTLISAVVAASFTCWLGFELMTSDVAEAHRGPVSWEVHPRTVRDAKEEPIDLAPLKLSPQSIGLSPPSGSEGVEIDPASFSQETGEGPNRMLNPPHVMRPDNPNRSYVAKSYFEEKYTDASLEDLMTAKSRLEVEMNLRLPQESQEFFDAGRGDVVIRKQSESLDSSSPAIVANDGLITASQSEVTPSGDLITRTGKLQWNEYSDLYDT